MSKLSIKEIIGPLPAIIALIVVVLSSVVLDQVTKHHSAIELKTWDHETDIDLYKGQRLRLGGFGDEFGPDTYIAFNFNYVRNQGAAWGTLANMRDKYRIPFFVAVTMIAVLVLALYFRSTPPSHRMARYGLALIFSGAIGNFIDRIRLGYVVDWIDVHWRLGSWQYYFPNFNIADIAISLGVGFLLVDTIVFDIQRIRLKRSLALLGEK